jgi:hypothetical protein
LNSFLPPEMTRYVQQCVPPEVWGRYSDVEAVSQ